MNGFRIGCVLVLGLLSGCDSRTGDTPPGGGDAKQQRARVVPPGTARIAGRVNLVGFTPTQRTMRVKCEHDGTVPDETVVADGNGGLKNVVVYLREASSAGPTSRPAAVLDQVSCRYVPHVLAVEVGQELIVRSSDATLHNVHTRSEANPSLNFGMAGKGQKSLRFDRPEFVRARCDVHPWMSAHVAVMDHPYFAVTGDGGTFAIENVPAGSYTLVARHEKFDEVEQQVTVQDGSSAEVQITYRPPTE